jgi:hypothetical protein
LLSPENICPKLSLIEGACGGQNFAASRFLLREITLPYIGGIRFDSFRRFEDEWRLLELDSFVLELLVSDALDVLARSSGLFSTVSFTGETYR